MSICNPKVAGFILSSAITSAIVAAGVSYAVVKSGSTDAQVLNLKAELIEAQSALATTQTEANHKNESLIQSRVSPLKAEAQVTLNKLNLKIQAQEKVVAKHRQRLLEFSKQTGINYFDHSPADTNTPSLKATAADYTRFIALKQQYERALSNLDTLRSSHILEELRRSTRDK